MQPASEFTFTTRHICNWVLFQLWKILKEMGIPDHFTCLLRNLYAVEKATVRTRHGTTGWFKIGKGVRQGCILSPCLFNLYAEYIIWNARLGESQVGIKISWRNINHLRYTNDNHSNGRKWRGTEEPFDEGEREWKDGLKFNIQKTKIMASSPNTSWQIDGEKWKQWQTLFSWAPKPLQTLTAAMKLKDTCSLGESCDKPREHIKKQRHYLPTNVHLV